MNNYKGFFLVVEGPGGSGKSTLMNRLEEWAKQRNLPYVRTREPGGTFASDYLRPLCRSGIPGNPVPLHPMTEALLFNAARVENIQQVIIPALQEGKLVICDRFYHSTVAYQTRTGQVEVDQLLALHDVVHDLRPDRTLILDGCPAKFNGRVADEEKAADFGDSLKLSEMQRIREVYRYLAQEPDHVLIDGEQTADNVFTQIFPWLQAIEGYIFKRPVMTPDLPETICFKGSRVLRTLDQEHVDRLFEELSAEAHKENDCYLIH